MYLCIQSFMLSGACAPGLMCQVFPTDMRRLTTIALKPSQHGLIWEKNGLYGLKKLFKICLRIE
jgi:hypothetical protein